jgi:hypothetical protein
MSSNSFIKKHPKLTLIFFNISLLLLVFIVLEIVIRIFAPGWLVYRMKYLNTGNLEGFGTDAHWDLDVRDGQIYSFKPGTNFKVYNTEYENTVHINSFGGRNTEANEKKDTNKIIPFMGDSFVFGIGVEDTETMVSITRKMTGNNFLNFGFPGTCIVDQRRMINTRYDKLKPPSIVIYGFFLGNDFEDIIKNHSRDSSKAGSSVIPKKDSASKKEEVKNSGFAWRMNRLINHSFLRKLYSLQFIKQKLLNIKNKGKAKDMDLVFYLLDSKNTEHIKQARTDIDIEIKKLSEDAYQPIVVLIPDRYQVSSPLRKSMCAYYNLDEKYISPYLPNQILIEALDKYKIKYIDPTRCLIAHSAEGALYYTQDNHLTKLGQKIISECITDSLRTTINQLRAREKK